MTHSSLDSKTPAIAHPLPTFLAKARDDGPNPCSNQKVGALVSGQMNWSVGYLVMRRRMVGEFDRDLSRNVGCL